MCVCVFVLNIFFKSMSKQYGNRFQINNWTKTIIH